MRKKKIPGIVALVALALMASCSKTDESSSSPLSSSSSMTNSSSQDIALTRSVTFKAVDGVTFSLDREDGKYKAGETVEISATVTTDGKGFSSFVSNDVKIETVSSSPTFAKGTFKMPDKDVEISVELMDTDGMIRSITNLNDASISSISLIEGDKFKTGDTVTFKVYSPEDYPFSKAQADYVFFYVNDKIVEVEFPKEENTDSSPYLEGSFQMPEGGVDIVVTLAYSTESETGYSINIEENQYVKFYGFDPAKKYETVDFFAVKTVGYKLESFKSKAENSSDWTSVDASNSSSNPLIYRPSNFTLTENTTLKAEGSFVGSKKITYVNSDRITSADTLIEEYTVGDKVRIYNITPKEQYSIVKKATLEGVDTKSLSDNDFNLTTIEFEMPENDVTITFNTVDNAKVLYTENENIKSVRAVSEASDTGSRTYFPRSATFYVFPVAKEGYIVESAVADDGQTGTKYTTSNGEICFLFHMPDTEGTNLTITFTLEQGYVVSANESEGGNVVFYNTTYKAGETVTFGIVLDSVFYNLDGIEAIGHADLAIKYSKDLVEDNTYIGSFTMPEYDVTLSPSYSLKDIAIISASFDESMIKGIAITGYTSGSSLTSAGTQEKFLVGESLGIYAYHLEDTAYSYTLVITEGESEVTLSPTSETAEYSFFNYTVTSSTSSLEFKAVKSEKFTFTVNNPIPLNIAYKNKETGTRVYAGNEIDAGTTIQISAGFGLKSTASIKVEIDKLVVLEGEVTSYSDPLEFVLTGNATITVEKAV